MIRQLVFKFVLLSGLFVGTQTIASTLEVQKVTDNVYAVVGAIGQRAPDNLGNNATYGFVITKAGVVLIDAGGSFKGAKKLHQAIQTITKKKIIVVINTGGQDQRWMGNDYFKKQGAKIIAAKATVHDQKKRVNKQLSFLEKLVGKKGMAGTLPVYADEIFDAKHNMTIGGVQFYLNNPGTAHTPGDTYVWLPQHKIAFSGDIIYVERILAVSSVSKSKGWLHSFEKIASLKPIVIVPGHGHIVDLKKATADTYDYLVALREGVNMLIDQGEGLESVSRINQSQFNYLKFFDDLKGRNAHQVFQEMEWD
ncbi:MAG: MBL fold metallo-hydrolase [Woeseiaceae bacterium]